MDAPNENWRPVAAPIGRFHPARHNISSGTPSPCPPCLEPAWAHRKKLHALLRRVGQSYHQHRSLTAPVKDIHSATTSRLFISATRRRQCMRGRSNDSLLRLWRGHISPTAMLMRARLFEAARQGSLSEFNAREDAISWPPYSFVTTTLPSPPPPPTPAPWMMCRLRSGAAAWS